METNNLKVLEGYYDYEKALKYFKIYIKGEKVM